MELKLDSLGGYEPITYQWPYHFKDQGCEIIEAISFACQEEPPLRKYLDDILTGCVVSSYESMTVVCQRFNQAVDHLRSLVTSGLYQVQRRASVKLLHHVVQTCYNRAVVDPEKLNHYEPFSAEVYGETSFELVHQMIETIKFTENDKFIDLGSGVGHVVLQVAASTPCKSCYGIEKAHWPALYAKQMSTEFTKWMKFFGKECGSYDLLKGNFLSDDFKDIVSNATVIFVNNFAFGPQVDHELKLQFSNLKEGTKIVSSKAFCGMNVQITERNLSDIGAILTVEELSPLRGPVSWTPKRVTYYLHTIDRTQLEEYFKMRQNPVKKFRKTLSSNEHKASKKQMADLKMNKISKVWRRSGMMYKQPPTISMVSTITAVESKTVACQSSIKKALWNDSMNSTTHPAYVFSPAQAFTFGNLEVPPVASNNCQTVSDIQNNLINNTQPVINVTDELSPKRQYLLQCEITPKMGFDSKTPISTPSSKDLFLGFCSDENELSEELQKEIENIITLFHDETSKISRQDVYKPSAVFNDLTLIQDCSMQVVNRFEENNLLSADVKKSSDLPKQVINENDSRRVENVKCQSLTPSVEMPKITVSLPRFSPITPETPTNSLKNPCVKKCIPFPYLGKTNDLFVNTSITGNVNNPIVTKECNQKSVSDDLAKTPSSSFSKLKLPYVREQKTLTPIITPASQPVSCPSINEREGTKSLRGIDEYSPIDGSYRGSQLSDMNQANNSWKQSSLRVSLPKKILDNSQISTDESLLCPHNDPKTILNPAMINDDNDDDDDPPELLLMMSKFRRQYKHLTKSMRHPSFKNKLVEDLNRQRSFCESLHEKISFLNSELYQLQYQNRILYQRFVERNFEEYPSLSSSPGLLDKAVCLDSTLINEDNSIFTPENKSVDQLPRNYNTFDKMNDFHETQAPSPEMPLLSPETCSNFAQDEQCLEHSKFTPPPRLTVCTDEPKAFNDPIPNNQPLHCETNSRLTESSGHPICFSPISSCSTESPLQSPMPNDNRGNIRGSNMADRVCSPIKSRLTDNMYYSLFSSSMQNMVFNPLYSSTILSDVKFTCENTEPNCIFKKRKLLEEAPHNLMRTKRTHLSNDLLNHMDENAIDNVVLRNVLNSKGPSSVSCTDSRSDSRDSGFGKDSETDNEATNRPKQHKQSKAPLQDPPQNHYLYSGNQCEIPQVNYQSIVNGANLANSLVNLRENHCQVLACDDVFRYPGNQQHICQFPVPVANRDVPCFSYSGDKLPRPLGSFELSFSSLADYYENYLSQDGRSFVHDNLKNKSSNHFNLSRHSFPSAFT